MGHRAHQATRCQRCRLHVGRCICGDAEPIATRTRTVVVMHCRELEKPTATAPLALGFLSNSELHVHGARDERVELSHLNDPATRTLLLYPGEGAVPLTQELVQKDPRPIQMVVPDGNWRQAARAARRLPGLEHAERVFLADGRPSTWGMRLEPKPNGLSTFEAIARALGLIEGPAVEHALDAIFQRAMAETRAARGYPGEPSLSEQVSVLFQDEALLVVDKPSGMLVHRDKGRREPALLQLVRDQIGEWVYPVHRLDRGTSGAVLLGRTSSVARAMAEQFEQGSIRKRYLALCRGHDPELTFADTPLPRDLTGEPQPARTHFRLLGASGRYGLYEVRPETGRRHQIRLHLKQKSHPIIGDVRYGKGEHNRLFREQYGFHRLALHAWELEFVSPESGQRTAVRAPLSSDFAAALAGLGLEVPSEIPQL